MLAAGALALAGAALAGTAVADSCTLPGAPGAVTASSADPNSAAATWTAAADNGSPLTGYLAQSGLGGAAGPAVAVAPAMLSATLTGVMSGPTQVRVSAVSDCGVGPAVLSDNTVTVTGAASTYASTVLLDNPSAYYRLGEDDSSQLGADSAPAAQPLTYTTTPRSTAGALTNDTDRAADSNGSTTIGSSQSALPQGNSPRTVEAWVRPEHQNAGAFARWGTESIYQVGTDDGGLWLDSAGERIYLNAGRSLMDGGWHHVVVAVGGRSVTVYVDGVKIGTATLSDDLSTDGGSGFVADQYHGGVDELAVYDEALTDEQVAAHFAASGSMPPAPVTGVTVKKVGYNDLQVAWTLPTTHPKPDPSAYVVEAQATVPGGRTRSALAVGPNATGALITGLPATNAYTVRVTPVSPVGTGPAATSSTAVKPAGDTSTYASMVRKLNPAAYYRLDEAAGVPVGADSSGTGHPLQYTVHRGYLPSGGLVNADAASSDNGDGSIGRNFAGTVVGGNGARSVEAWIKPADASDHMIGGWGTGYGNSFSVGVKDSDILVTDGSQLWVLKHDDSLVDGHWHHVVVTYDSGALTSYIDGVPAGTATTGDLATSAGGLVVGDGAPGVGHGWAGGLDEVAVYPGVLSAATVAQHFARSAHGAPGTPGKATAISVTNGLRVTWGAAPAPAADGVDAYIVTALKNGSTPVNSVVVSGTTRTATVRDLAGGVVYSARITPFNGYGKGTGRVSNTVRPGGDAPTYSSSVRSDLPLAYYRFGEALNAPSLADSSGHGLVAMVRSGRLGDPGALGGADTAAAVSATGPVAWRRVTNLPLGSDARTVEAQVKPADAGVTQFVAGWGDFEVGVHDAAVIVKGGAEQLTFDAPATLVGGDWHHVAVVAGGDSVEVFLDGVSLGSQTFTAPLATDGDRTFVIGAGSTTDTYHGGLDELAVYGKKLSAAHLAAH